MNDLAKFGRNLQASRSAIDACKEADRDWPISSRESQPGLHAVRASLGLFGFLDEGGISRSFKCTLVRHA